MPTVYCSACGRMIQLAPTELACTVECARCGHRFRPTPLAPTAEGEPPMEPVRVSFDPPRRSPYPAWLLLALAAVPVLAGAATMALILSSRPGSPKAAPKSTALALSKPAIPEPPAVSPWVNPDPPRRPASSRSVQEVDHDYAWPPLAPPTHRAGPTTKRVAEVRSPPKEPPVKPNPAEQAMLKRINLYRALAGQAKVSLSPALNCGAAAHARYLVQNSGRLAVAGLYGHQEDPNLPGFSESGQKAAGAALLDSWRGRVAPGWPALSVDHWMATFYHRIPLLNPNLKIVGVGFATSPQGKEGHAVVDVRSGAEASTVVLVSMFPAADQKNIPVVFGFGILETPNPIPDNGSSRQAGFPITVTFWNASTVENVQASLREKRAGRVLPVWLSTPEAPGPVPDLQQNTVCLIPKTVLKPFAVYAVEVSATVDGMDWKRTWSFTTAH